MEAVDWSQIHDVHCHLVEREESLPLIETLKCNRVWLMGTRPSEWPLVEQSGIKFPRKVAMAFGIHPWFAHEFQDTDDAIAQLRKYLVNQPASFVGEIGLDGIATHADTKVKYDMDHQLRMFTAQMKLAAELQRPVSVHAVGCFGKLESYFMELCKDVPKDLSRKEKERIRRSKLEADPATTATSKTTTTTTASTTAATMESQVSAQSNNNAMHPSLNAWPPAIMLHSYSGSPETIRNIMRYPSLVSSRFYFSFSHFVNGRMAFEKLQQRIAQVPDDRILIESDLNDPKVVDEACFKALEMVANAKGWSLDEATKRVGANAARFLGRLL
ncbi:hypothetical protein HDU78_007174 [Chytriomyces hyalinus]|nr:hypothetical protein HDU78_007174 [Chytriomyces hyalinus]KAJ3261228.1 hypothetical protein HDU77_000973 [Chytriomyces hyalinus]